MGFSYKTKPFEHQRVEFDTSRSMPTRALWWEQGTGKTKPMLDTFASMHDAGEVDGMLMMAPNGIQRNWVREEIPIHLPDHVADRADVFLWESKKAAQVGYTDRWKAFLKERDRPAILCMSYDSLMTKLGGAAARKYLESRRCMYVLDESTEIRSPGAKRTIRVLASGKYAPVRRILDGTPVDESPFEIYSQAKFIDPEVWHPLGCRSFEAFKTRFGIFVQRQLKNGRSYPDLVKYKDLHRLFEMVDSIGSRVLKKDVLKDLPPKVYTKIFFDLSPAQQRMYDQMRDEYMTWFGDGRSCTAELAIVRQTRLQQICSGYIPADDEDEPTELVDPKNNPRLVALREAVASTTGKFIVWGKYDIDIDLIAADLRNAGIETATYDGRTADEDRDAAIAGFQRGNIRAFVGKPRAAGRGLTLTAADTVIYYNNEFRLRMRRQSEDRAHRAGLDHVVRYIDIIGERTIDEYIIEVLQKKLEVASMVMGDDLPPWLNN